MQRLFNIFKAESKDILGEIAEYWNVRLHIWRIKQAVKIGKYYSIAGNARIYILPDHKGKPQAYFKQNIKDNVKSGYFQQHVLQDTWLLKHAIEIIDKGETLLNRNEYKLRK